jgi:hypothetical protein
MHPNTHSTPADPADGLTALQAVANQLATQPLDDLPDPSGPPGSSSSADSWTACKATGWPSSPPSTPGRAAGTQHLPQPHHRRGRTGAAGSGRLDPPRLRRVVGHFRLVADPTAPRPTASSSGGRGRWLAAPGDARIALDGLLEPEAGQTVLAALEPWPARPTPPMLAVVASGGPMPWPSWPAGPWRAGGCPRPAASG